MIPAKFIYDSVTKDVVNVVENGNMNYGMANRCFKRGELRLIDYLTGDVEGVKPPEMYLSTKNKDWVSFLIKSKKKNVYDGIFEKPEDYYRKENLYWYDRDTQKPIEVLNGAQFNSRTLTPIKGLRPKDQPIAKVVGNNFVILPRKVGVVELEYIRYPIFANIKTVIDPVYNEEVIDEAASTDFEWGEWATELLIYFVTESYAFYNRDTEALNFNKAIGKLVRAER